MVTPPKIDSFLDKLIDWKEFEQFVAELYKDSDEVLVQHNVTETGKSGAKRQIDVKVTQKTKLHTLTTIIECKRWKEKVDRQIIDVLFASVEDLNANKGAIFTTQGYEEGAIQYARSKNIDIFIIRDIYEDEWGKPGRIILVYLQYFHSMMDNFSFGNPRIFSTTGTSLPNLSVDFAINLGKDQPFPERLQLYSLKEPPDGPNFVKLLIDIRNHLLKQLMEQVDFLLQPADGKPEQGYETSVKLDFSNYPFRFFKHEAGFISFDSISFRHHQSISQIKMEHDRASSADFALVVENYITRQRNFASKKKDENQIKLSEPLQQSQDSNDDKAVKNGSVMKVMLEHYVSFELQPATKVMKTPDMTVALKAPAAK